MARRYSIPKYRRQRSKGKDRAIVEIAGRRYYLGEYDSPVSKSKYGRLIAEWQAAHGHLPAPRDEITVSECIAAYLRFARGYYRKQGRDTGETARIRVVARVLVQLYGATAAVDFGPLKLKTCRHAFVDAGNCRRTVNQKVLLIKRVFRWCVSEELIPGHIIHSLQSLANLKRGRTKAKESEPVRPVPDEYVDAIRKFVSAPVWTAVQVQRLTGMRSTELLSMRPCDLDMTGRLWVYRPVTHKTEHHGRERVIEIGPRVQDLLRPLLKPDVNAYLFSARDALTERYAKARTHRRPGQSPNPRKTQRRVRDRYDRVSYHHAIRQACDAADRKAKEERGISNDDSERIIPRWHPHQLRHNYATMVRREYGVEAARIVLGHASVGATELYAEADRARAGELVAKKRIN